MMRNVEIGKRQEIHIYFQPRMTKIIAQLDDSTVDIPEACNERVYILMSYL
jgi:hypothetical protein